MSATSAPSMASQTLKSPSDITTPARKRRRRTAGGGAQDDCFTCRKRASQCDRKRPYCSQCIAIGKDCSGYKTTLTWGMGVASRGKLRGMSLPIADEENKMSQAKSQPPAISRRKSSSARFHLDIHGGESRRSSRQSSTSHPVPIQPAIGFERPSMPQQQANSFPRSVPSDLPQYRTMPIPISRPLHRLQTSLGSYHDDCYYSDSASSTGSFYDADYNTPIDGIAPPDSLQMLSSYDNHIATFPEDMLSSMHGSMHSLDGFEPQFGHQELPAFETLSIPDHMSYSMDLPSAIEEEDSAQCPDASPNPYASIQFTNPLYNVQPRIQSLIHYYDTQMCPRLVAFDGPQNPYRMHIIQMATQNEALQNAVAALVTNNMRMRRLLPDSAPDHQVTDRGLLQEPDDEETLYKQTSVNHLNQQLAMTTAAQDDSVLATLLVLCLFHTCDSGFSKFRTQLAGVHKLLSMREQHQRSSFTDWVEMFFMWFDAMTSAVNDREMVIECASVGMLEYSANLGALEQFSGCDGRLFKLIARLGRLNLLAQGRSVSGSSAYIETSPAVPSRTATPDMSSTNLHKSLYKPQASARSLDARDYENLDGNGWLPQAPSPQNQDWLYRPPVHMAPAHDSRKEFWSEWHDIRSRLQAWQMESSVMSGWLSSPHYSGTEHQGDMLHISEAFRHAALLYTERLSHPLLPSASQRIQQHVNMALAHIAALPVHSCVNKFLLWPLFIAGTECVSAASVDGNGTGMYHRILVRERILDIQRESGFYNNLSALEVLERVWSDVDVGQSDASEMHARRRDSETGGSVSPPSRQAFRWRIAMDRVDGEYLII